MLRGDELEMSDMRKVLLAIAFATTSVTPANAALIFNVEQVGSDVVATATGTVDLSGAVKLFSGGFAFPGIGANTIAIGAAGPIVTVYELSGTSSKISSTAYKDTRTSIGSAAIIDGYSKYIALSSSYINRSQIASLAIFADQTLDSLGLTPNSTYSYSLPNDTVTITIGNAVGVVPEPAQWMLLIGGFSLAGTSLRCRRQAARRKTNVVRIPLG